MEELLDVIKVCPPDFVLAMGGVVHCSMTFNFSSAREDLWSLKVPVVPFNLSHENGETKLTLVNQPVTPDMEITDEIKAKYNIVVEQSFNNMDCPLVDCLKDKEDPDNQTSIKIAQMLHENTDFIMSLMKPRVSYNGPSVPVSAMTSVLRSALAVCKIAN